MPYTLVLFVWRKPGTSPAEFKQYYEDSHVPLLRSLLGGKFPLTHSRHYIQRSPGQAAVSDNTNTAHLPVVFVGEAADFDYDAYAELVFEDEARFKEFFAFVSTPEIAAQLAADEEKFADRAKLRIASVDQMSVTRRS